MHHLENKPILFQVSQMKWREPLHVPTLISSFPCEWQVLWYLRGYRDTSPASGMRRETRERVTWKERTAFFLTLPLVRSLVSLFAR